MMPWTCFSWSLLSLRAFQPGGSGGGLPESLSFLSPETPTPTTRASVRKPRPASLVRRDIVPPLLKKETRQLPCYYSPSLFHANIVAREYDVNKKTCDCAGFFKGPRGVSQFGSVRGITAASP